MQDTSIEWATHTFNAWEGCSKVSPGCANCYAEARAKRLGTSKWGPQGTRVVRSEAFWRQPARWNREANWCGNTVCRNMPRPTPGKCSCGLDVERPRVFCNSLSDVFEDWQGGEDGDGSMTCYKTGEELSINANGTVWPMGWPSLGDGDDWGARAYTMVDVRARLFRLIDATPNLDWLIVTKRPENINRLTPPRDLGEPDETPMEGDAHYFDPAWSAWRPNVWHLTSVEDQATADARIPELLKVRSAVLGLSMEPLLGPVDIRRYLPNTFTGFPRGPRVGWAIVGGESGRNARTCSMENVRGVVRQCHDASVSVFVKQLGARPVDPARAESVPGATVKRSLPVTDDDLRVLGECLDAMTVTLNDPKGGDPAEWPEDLRVREFPTPRSFR